MNYVTLECLLASRFSIDSLLTGSCQEQRMVHLGKLSQSVVERSSRTGFGENSLNLKM